MLQDTEKHEFKGCRHVYMFTEVVSIYGVFLYMTQEILIGLYTEARKLPILLTDHTADRKRFLCITCRSTLYREIGSATQRNIDRDIIERSAGRLPEHNSALLAT
jgi:hypothetical protein